MNANQPTETQARLAATHDIIGQLIGDLVDSKTESRVAQWQLKALQASRQAESPPPKPLESEATEAALRSQIERQHKTHESLHREHQSLKQLLESKTTEVTSLRLKLNSQSDELASAQTSNASKDKEIETLKAQLAAAVAEAKPKKPTKSATKSKTGKKSASKKSDA